MGLSSRLIIAKGSIKDSQESLIQKLGFKNPKKIKETGLLGFRVLPDNQVAIGEANGFVFICHHEIPMYLIENEMSRNNYPGVEDIINDLCSGPRFIAAIFQGSINGFGYGIYKEGDQMRQLMGDYEGIMCQWGNIQEEEKMILNHPDPSNQKASYREKEYDLHEIGTELTHDVLNNYCGQDFIMDDLIMTVYEVA